MEIGLGIDARFALSLDDQRALAHEAKQRGYRSLWTPAAHTKEPFELCATWHEWSGLETGIAVVPLSSWSLDDLSAAASETVDRVGRRFTLGIGTGRLTEAPVRAMRDAAAALRARLAGVRLYVGALGPQMLRLAGARYDGAALNWCSVEQVAWSREHVNAGARASGRDPQDVKVHEYIRICIDEHEPTARVAFAKMVMAYALDRPGTDKTKGYRGHFARMGFDEALTDLETRRDRGTTEDELARLFPAELLRRVGYWGPADGARSAFLRLAQGLDIAVVRPVAATRNDVNAVRAVMNACAPSR